MSMDGMFYRNPAQGSITSNNMIFTAHSSGQIKSTLGRYCMPVSGQRSVELDVHRASEQHKTRQRLSLAHAGGLSSMAQQCVAVRHDHETQLLLELAESGGDHTLESAVHVARSARDTLIAEEELALSELKECQLKIMMLQDTVEEARIYVADASRQVGNLLSHLNSQGLPIPRILETSYPIPASVVSIPSYQSCLQAYIPNNRSIGSNSPGYSAHSENSDAEEGDGSDTSFED